MCLNHPCYESLNRYAASKPARIIYGVLLVIIVAVFGWRLLQASDRLQVQREREASRLEVIPHTKDGLILIHAANQTDVETWKAKTDKGLLAYSSHKPNSNPQTCDYDHPITSDKVCDVDLRYFGPCRSHNNYEYHKASPCIFIKFKKVNDWVPKNLNASALPKDMPEDLKYTIKESNQQKVWLSCEGDSPADVEHIGPINYFPERAFLSYYFPFTGQDGYLEPLVAIQLEKPTTGIVIMIKCTAWSGDFQDSIKFEIMVD